MDNKNNNKNNIVSPSIQVMQDSLEYYDKNFDIYHNKFKDVKYIKLIPNDSNIIHEQIELYDKDKNLLFKYYYEFIGQYESSMQLWCWAWAIAYIPKKFTIIIRKILLYGVELEYNDYELLKLELITSRFRIMYKIQLDIHLAIASYLAKKPIIFKYLDILNNPFKENTFYDITQPINLDTDKFIENYLFLIEI
jgi:hypothetical protein